jgi:hypothetical protein
LRWAIGILSDVGNDAVRWGLEKLHGLSFLAELRQVVLVALHRLVRVLRIDPIRVNLGFEETSFSRFDLEPSASAGSGRPLRPQHETGWSERPVEHDRDALKKWTTDRYLRKKEYLVGPLFYLSPEDA